MKTDSAKLKEFLALPTTKSQLDPMIRRPVTLQLSLGEIRENMLLQKNFQSTYAWAKAYCQAYEKTQK